MTFESIFFRGIEFEVEVDSDLDLEKVICKTRFEDILHILSPDQKKEIQGILFEALEEQGAIKLNTY